MSVRPQSALVRGRVAVILFFVLNGIIAGSWAARIPAIQSRLGLNPAQLSLALLASAGGLVASATVMGGLVGRYGSHRAVRFAAPLYCLTLPVAALAPNLAFLAGALLIFGASAAALDVSMNSQAVLVERGYGRPIMSSFHAMFSAGGFLGSTLGGFLAARAIPPLPHFLAVAAILVGVSLLASRWTLPEKAAPTSEASEASKESPPLLALPSRRLLGLSVIAFAALLAEGAIGDWSAVYLRQTLHAFSALAPAGYATFSVTMALGRFGGDRLTTWLGPTRMLRGGTALAALGLALTLLAPHPLLAVAGFGVAGLGCATLFPLVISSGGKLGGVPGRAVAALTTMGYLGFLAGPPLIGGIATVLTLRGSFAVVVALLLGSAILARTASQPVTNATAPASEPNGEVSIENH